MGVIMSVKITGHAAIPAKQIKPILFKALTAVGFRWRDKWLKVHFKNLATHRYGYTPRQGERGSHRKHRGSYTWRKLRDKKHSKPLVWSGKSRDDALATTRIRAFGTASNAKVTIALPSTFNLRAAGSDIKMHEEVTAVIPSEVKDLETFFVFRFERGLKAAGKSAKVKAQFLAA